MKSRILTISLAFFALSPLVFGNAEALYNKSCASCHGKDGKGQTAMGKKSKARDYTTAEGQDWTDAEGIKAILEGVKEDGKSRMKGYSDKITEVEAKELVAFIRKFKK